MQRTDIRGQFLWYLVVGGLAFLTELASFVSLLWLGMAVMPASVLSFIIATVANYFLSYLIAFRRGRHARHQELGRFIAVALIGLLLNTACVWFLHQILGWPSVVAKVSAVPVVLIWNFLGRRLFVFHAEIPEATVRVTNQALDTVGITPDESQ